MCRIICIFVTIIRDRNLFLNCSEAIRATLKYFQELTKNEAIGNTVHYRATIEQGQFRRVSPLVQQDNGRFVYNHMTEIQKLPEVAKLQGLLHLSIVPVRTHIKFTFYFSMSIPTSIYEGFFSLASKNYFLVRKIWQISVRVKLLSANVYYLSDSYTYACLLELGLGNSLVLICLSPNSNLLMMMIRSSHTMLMSFTFFQ